MVLLSNKSMASDYLYYIASNYFLIILDPFDLKHNLGRSLTLSSEYITHHL